MKKIYKILPLHVQNIKWCVCVLINLSIRIIYISLPEYDEVHRGGT